jgi:hypothetical protein
MTSIINTASSAAYAATSYLGSAIRNVGNLAGRIVTTLSNFVPSQVSTKVQRLFGPISRACSALPKPIKVAAVVAGGIASVVALKRLYNRRSTSLETQKPNTVRLETAQPASVTNDSNDGKDEKEVGESKIGSNSSARLDSEHEENSELQDESKNGSNSSARLDSVKEENSEVPDGEEVDVSAENAEHAGGE